MSHPRWCFVDRIKEFSPDHHFQLSDWDSDHFRKVMRLSVGDTLTVVCKQSGRAVRAQIQNLKSPITVEIKEELTVSHKISNVKSVICALLKGDSNDLVVEKATELGVEEIIFAPCTRSVLKITDDNKLGKKLVRWNNIAEAAAKQTMKHYCPKVLCLDALESIQNAISDNTLKLYGSLEPIAQSIHNLKFDNQPVSLVIGPEGDFTEQEFALLKDLGFIPVSLGPGVLKAETAVIAGIAKLQALADR